MGHNELFNIKFSQISDKNNFYDIFIFWWSIDTPSPRKDMAGGTAIRAKKVDNTNGGVAFAEVTFFVSEVVLTTSHHPPLRIGFKYKIHSYKLHL